jgi:outer membrane biosynthesis protein TonB
MTPSIALQVAAAKLTADTVEGWKTKAAAWHADNPAMREFVSASLALEQVQALHALTAEVHAQRESTDALIKLLESMAVEEEEEEAPEVRPAPEPTPVEAQPKAPKQPKPKREKPAAGTPEQAPAEPAPNAVEPPAEPKKPTRTRGKKQEPAS